MAFWSFFSSLPASSAWRKMRTPWSCSSAGSASSVQNGRDLPCSRSRPALGLAGADQRNHPHPVKRVQTLAIESFWYFQTAGKSCGRRRTDYYGGPTSIPRKRLLLTRNDSSLGSKRIRLQHRPYQVLSHLSHSGYRTVFHNIYYEVPRRTGLSGRGPRRSIRCWRQWSATPSWRRWSTTPSMKPY